MLRFSAQSSHRLRKAAIASGFVVLAIAGLRGLEPALTYLDPRPSDGHMGSSAAGFSERVALGAPFFDMDWHGSAGKVVVYDTPSRVALRTLYNPFPGDDEDQFGASLAALGSSKLVVGTPKGDGGVGVVYVFDIDTGERLLTIENPDPDAGDGFGIAVGVIATGKILVGAPGEGTEGFRAGAAYVFDGTTGDLLQTLFADDAAPNAEFGTAVAGNQAAIVGAPGAADDAGRAYILDPEDGTVLHRLGNPSPGAGAGGDDQFGAAVATDWFNVIVGAPGEDVGEAQDAGAAYYFSGDTGELLRTLANPDPDADDIFGSALAGKASNYVVVGAPKDDGEANNAGAAYLFDASSGALLRTFSDSASAEGEQCGEAVALSSGSGFVVGCAWANAGRAGSGKGLLYQEAPGPEISVHYKNLSIKNGGATTINVGGMAVGGSKSVPFSILNIGSARLSLTGNPRASLVKERPRGCFMISRQPGATVDTGLTTSFELTFLPAARGECTAAIEIPNNDASERTFVFNVKGTGT